jgi:GT2 family glycosyltransferase
LNTLNTTPTVGIIIPTYNRLEFLTQCIDSIRQNCNISHEVIVVDGGSTDGTIEYLKSQQDIQSIFEGELTGAVNACNAGFSASVADYVCTLNDDCLLNPNGLKTAAEVLRDNSEIGLVGLKTFEPGSENTEAAYIGGVGALGFVTQNFFLVRRDLLNKLGGFSTDYKMYGSDIDLTASVMSSGFKVATTKVIVQRHMKAWEGIEDDDDDAQERRLADRNHGKATFERRFAYVGPRSTRNRIKAGIGRILIKTIYRPSRGRKTFLGLSSRDVRNITRGRYISLFDPFRQIGKTYHLIQRPTNRLIDHPGKPQFSPLEYPTK